MKKKQLISIASFVILSFGITNYSEAQNIETIAGNGVMGYSGDGGQATAAEIHNPDFMAIDAVGNVYVTDYYNYVIRKITPAGIISTFAGTGSPGFSGDGGQATAASFDDPLGIAIDAAGNIYMSDELNNRIRKINSSGVITTIGGNGTAGFSGDGGQATNAELSWPAGLAFDASGNLYIGDYANSAIRKITPAGIITTVAGNGVRGFSGDGGQATAAEMNLIHGLVTDAAGNIYFDDFNNNRVRKVTPAGIITTIVGNGVGGFSGDGGPATAAELNTATGIDIDAAGNLYIADYSNSAIRMVNTSGIISTIAGNNIAGYSGDGGPATAAELNYAYATILDHSGNIYISDAGNMRLRVFANPNKSGESINEVSGNNHTLSVYPNPANNNLYVNITGMAGTAYLSVYNLVGQELLKQEAKNENIINLDVKNISAGMYILKVQTEDGSTLVRKFEISK
jgi:sugar lactone lactonase YvrE